MNVPIYCIIKKLNISPFLFIYFKNYEKKYTYSFLINLKKTCKKEFL